MSAPRHTIAAIATAPGRGGIGIVRVSGSNVPDMLDPLLGRNLVPRLATHCAFRSADGAVIDEGIALYFPAPHSYTGEHVLELHGHGGPAVLALLLERCLACGARLAAPGEFTQRAFLEGKLDLAQAEAVADLIEASTGSAARAAARSLSGEFSREVHTLADGLLDLRMLAEATLDFPEEDIDFLRAADAAGRASRLRAALSRLTERTRRGALLREGLTVVLVGRPNVGKSSLMNRLSRDDLAIVTEIPGTTRDALRAPIEIGGIAVTVIDTAGLRATDDPIETLGIERTWAAVEHASLALVIVDARKDEGIGEEDNAVLERLPASLPRIVVHNKIDLTGGVPHRIEVPHAPHRPSRRDVWLSARTGAGTELLEGCILDLAGAHEDMEDVFLGRARHLEALAEAARHLDAAVAELQQPGPALELFAEALREAHQALGAIVGTVTADDVLGAIFARFCIGK